MNYEKFVENLLNNYNLVFDANNLMIFEDDDVTYYVKVDKKSIVMFFNDR